MLLRLFAMFKEMAVKYSEVSEFISLDDKSIVPIEPNKPVSKGVRPHNRFLVPEGVKLYVNCSVQHPPKVTLKSSRAMHVTFEHGTTACFLAKEEMDANSEEQLLSFADICFFCGDTDIVPVLINEKTIKALKQQYSIVRPICPTCNSSGKLPAVRNAMKVHGKRKTKELSAVTC
ncbi:unnamed protein product [Mytilus edulis]|uniref:Uncharacterized protein n=1 Tax=Mytilus edulis TaxID=6550 RepID=A0A8S3RPN5_MYTED|nr:unnamed protein product [Mytilus edulis]